MKMLNGKVPLRFILDLYDAFLRESDMKKVADSLGLEYRTLITRMNTHPKLREVKELAESRRGNREAFSGYIYQHLSERAREIWDDLQFWDGNSASEKIEKILANKPKKIRQELFIHALINSGFDLSEACRITGVSRWTLNNNWKADPEFQELLEEIQWHKKNFFEHALLDLVEQRHPGAVMFVNRTVNADRGYTEKLEVHHGGSVDTTGFTIDDLDLSIECRKEILEAMRKKKEKHADVKEVENVGRRPALQLPEYSRAA